MREAVSRALVRAIEIRRRRSKPGADWLQVAPLLLAAVRSPELGRARATTVPGLPGLARNEEEDTSNSLVGICIRDRGQRGENAEGRTPGGSELFR
jgi:hypothetical protein